MLGKLIVQCATKTVGRVEQDKVAGKRAGPIGCRACAAVNPLSARVCGSPSLPGPPGRHRPRREAGGAGAALLPGVPRHVACAEGLAPVFAENRPTGVVRRSPFSAAFAPFDPTRPPGVYRLLLCVFRLPIRFLLTPPPDRWRQPSRPPSPILLPWANGPRAAGKRPPPRTTPHPPPGGRADSSQAGPNTMDGDGTRRASRPSPPRRVLPPVVPPSLDEPGTAGS